MTQARHPGIRASAGLLAVLLFAAACGTDQRVTSPEAVARVGFEPASSHGAFTTSSGIYRIPYLDGSAVRVTRDHHDHTPVNRIDMAGDVAGLQIVAAAAGTIRAVVDRHGNDGGAGDGLSANGAQAHDDALEHSCQDDDTVVGDCQDYNNYVWIEHPNGEWTKYTHFRTGSVGARGWQVGDWIDAGEVLGVEGDVGAASGRHLHWEVGLPNDASALTPFSALGGFMVSGFGVNLVPLVCDIPDQLYVSSEEYTANPCTHAAPSADAGGPYVVAEGSTIMLDGTGSSDPDGEPLTFIWRPAGAVSDSLLAEPGFTGVDDGVVELMLTVYDRVEALGDSAATTVTVSNVVPAVSIDPAQVTMIDEGGTLEVSAAFSDPGIADAPFTATVQCYDVPGYELTAPGVVAVTGNAGPLTGTITGSCPYGDTSRSGTPPAGTFTVTVRIADKDGGEAAASFEVTVRNQAPTGAIDPGGATVVNGAPVFLAAAGEPLDFAATVTDPGSDDLELTWDWADGSTTGSQHLLNPPAADPFPSPDVSPRAVAAQQTHAWAEACLYEITLTAADDDGGAGGTSAAVVIAGTSGRSRGVGYWLTLYRRNRSNELGEATLGCYLRIAEHMSAVFDEARAGTGSFAEAADMLQTNGSRGSMTEQLDQQLLAAWLNYANGAFAWDELVDTDADGIADTSFSASVTAAEEVRLDPAATRAALEAQKDVLEAINRMHGG